MKRPITEQEGVHEEWYARAKKMTLAELPAFLDELCNAYRHDYGTICYAVAAAAVAAAHAINASTGGGITGFQAQLVTWEFIRRFDAFCSKGPMRLVQIDKMLFPQYAHLFESTVDQDEANWLREQAREHLRQDGRAAPPHVRAHWEMMAEGWLPFGFSVREK